ncbi:hypothetical protein fugu_006062 [Takifugu bimaculatus]|uniref:Uncharacterized protein n=1 Tax=Takifugu bimaculatus TaxID=433685 RepID=A0A4Z2B642_9TELE|nr:hypothetical protein fugu_006062 [Takifugu bimaculatus]
MFSFAQRELSLCYCHGYQATARRNTPGTNYCHLRFSMSNVAPSPKVLLVLKNHNGRNSKELFQFFRNLPQVAPGRFQVNDGRWRGCCRRGSVSVWALLLCAGFLCRDWNAQPACEMLRMEVTHCSVLGFPSNLFAVSPGYSNTRELQGFSADKRWAGRPLMTGETCLNPNGRDAVMNACGYKRAGN